GKVGRTSGRPAGHRSGRLADASHGFRQRAAKGAGAHSSRLVPPRIHARARLDAERAMQPLALAGILGAVLGLAGCATDSAAPTPLSAEEAYRYCASQMYARRVGHARGAPSWTVYDYCVKQHQT